MHHPLFDLRAELAPHRDALEAAFARVLASARFVLGPEVEAFERSLSLRLHERPVVGVASGTDALVIALRALSLPAAGEVIVPSFTFAASAEAVVRAGLTPVFADVDPRTLCLDAEAVAGCVGPRTCAVMPVHLFGFPCAVDELRDALPDGVSIVEDAAQALGAQRNGVPVGALADAAAFSFFPTKVLGGFGDGGAAVFADPDVAARSRSLRQHGFASDKTDVEAIGWNSRLDAVQAALLGVRLLALDDELSMRRAAARRYDARIAAADLPGVRPAQPDVEGHARGLYVVRIAGGASRRDAVAAALAERGVGTGVYYRRGVHQMTAYRRWARGPLAHTEALSDEVLALPFGARLEASAQDAVVAALSDAVTALG